MASKKQKRSNEVRTRKKKKGWRTLALSAAALAIVGLLIFFFVTLFDALFPTSGKGTAQRKEKREVTLYFSDANERFLVPEKRFVPKEATDEEQAREIVKALLAGSKTGNTPTLPAKADVQGVKILQDGTAEVSFSKTFVNAHPGSGTSETASIFSLTNSLCTNVPAIKRVRIMLDGKELASIRGHIDTRKPFAPRDLTAPGAKS
ncbi:MAG TPA: GerMN domain-containing protein [Syntrophales bacterium]|nr:GerMN domain-containing protein [Syntrophales bacterium]